jgi:hypothetical protein
MHKPDCAKLTWIALVSAAALGAVLVAYALLHGPLPD